jgi:K+-transporting ATPase ATPase A chain
MEAQAMCLIWVMPLALAASYGLCSAQTIMMGPVAAFKTIKHLGTNGGGFFDANAAHPLENPTPLTNFVLMVMMALLPSALVILIGNRRQAQVLYGVMAALW